MYRLTLVILALSVFVNANAASYNDDDYFNLLQRGRAEYSAGAYSSAERLLAGALKLLGNRGDTLRRAEILSDLGSVYMNEDDLPKALHAYTQSLNLYHRLGDRTRIAMGLRYVGSVYSLQGEPGEALHVLQEALKIAIMDHDVLLQADVLNSIGVVHYRERNYSKAARYFNDALASAPHSAMPSILRSQLLNNLGNVYQALRKYPEAEALLKQAAVQIEADSGPSHPNLSSTILSLAYLYTDTGRYSEAEVQYRRVIAILEPRQPEFETTLARVLHAFSVMYAKAGKKEDANTMLERAAAIARRNVNQHNEMFAILVDYSVSLKSRGRSSEAAELIAEARRARVAAGLVVAGPQF